jgi:quercetin dioxygenase-like cupin family protein
MSNCTILQPGQGEHYWLIGEHLSFKIGPQQTGGAFSIAEFRTSPGGGPPPHVHANEDEMFYLIDGQLEFTANDKLITAGPGDVAFLPRNVPHTFKNTGSEPARGLTFSAPCGFEAFVNECGERVDRVPSDKVMNEQALQKVVARCGNYGISVVPDHRTTGHAPPRAPYRRLWVLGQLVTLKLTAADTQGSFSLCEVVCPPGAGVPQHLHHREDETFYVLEGTMEFQLGDQRMIVEKGGFVHVPKGTFHGFTTVGSAPSRMLDCHSPGGFEAFFEDAGTVCTDVSIGPPKAPPDMAKIMAMFEKHGMVLPAPR